MSGIAGDDTQVTLRDVTPADLPVFFDHQRDPVANQMAAFTATDPSDREAFMARWTMILANETIRVRTILAGNDVAGSILRYEEMGKPEVSYWLGREFWGRGIATRALALFIAELPERPLYARVAKDNIASVRVLTKCGFKIVGEDKGFANARGTEVEEYLMALAAA